MIIKKFQASTETEAILKAKENMGSSAVVMNIKTIKPRGIMRLFKKPMVEITAALEEKKEDSEITREIIEKLNANREKKQLTETAGRSYNTIYSEEGVQSDVIVEEPKRQVSNPFVTKYQEQRDDNLGKSTGEIEKKLANLQALLEERLEKEDNELKKKQEEQEEKESKAASYTRMIYNQLIDQEVDEKYANQIIDGIDRNFQNDSDLDYILSGIYQKMTLKLGESKPIELTKNKPKVVFFIGPTGVGKTTTIAKIASKFTLEEKCKVAMLTADTYRIAATEQLHTYADILNVPFQVIYSPEEITKAVTTYNDYDLILVDTAGHSHKNEQQLSEIKGFLDSIEDEEQKEVFLVLSATTKYADLLRIVDSYQGVKGFKLIFTKLDETTYYGNILNIRLYTDAELSYLTCGQNVPDDIEKLNSQKVVKQLLGGK